MIASAANGFMNTNPFDCTGTPFNFEPEYSSARAQNIIPWGIGPYMINNRSIEIGHFEPCTSLSGPATFTIGTSPTPIQDLPWPVRVGGGHLRDQRARRLAVLPLGDTHGGVAAPNLVTGCDVFFDAIGDLDYDGQPYYPDWPNSVKPDSFPSSFLQLQPTTVGGHGYPADPVHDRFQRDAVQHQLQPRHGIGLRAPAEGPGHFYPYFTQAKVGGMRVGIREYAERKYLRQGRPVWLGRPDDARCLRGTSPQQPELLIGRRVAGRSMDLSEGAMKAELRSGQSVAGRRAAADRRRAAWHPSTRFCGVDPENGLLEGGTCAAARRTGGLVMLARTRLT